MKELIKSLASNSQGKTPKSTLIYNVKIALELKGSCLKQDNATFTHRNDVNLFIVYKLDTWSRDLTTKFRLDNSFFEL